jgi:ribosome-binding protein aMBF1 (putative translation factor)
VSFFMAKCLLAVERSAKGLSQVELGQRLKIDPTTLSKIERGHVLPTQIQALRLEEFFDRHIDELLEHAGAR